MSKKYIIDGFNLGYKISEVQSQLTLGQVDRAIALIIQFINTNLYKAGTEIKLVFDGNRASRNHMYYNSAKIKIVFSKASETADDIIRKFIRKNKDIKSWTIVTSDNEILHTAKIHGAQIIKCEDFILLCQRPKKDASTNSHNNVKYDPQNIDIDYWLKQFGENN